MQKVLKKYFPVFAGPTLIAFFIAFLAPFVIGVYLSFSKFTTVTDASFEGVDNYIKAMTERQRFGQALFFTVLVTVVAIITVNLCAFGLAYLLTRKLKGTNFFRTVFFMPNLIGGIVLGYTWQVMINAILAKYGTTLIADYRYGFVGLILLMNWQMIGYMMIIYIAGLQNVPPELVEAATLDGAGRGQVLRHVTLPMIMPSITICLFLTLANSFKTYDANLALTAGAPRHQTEMLALNIVDTFYGRMGQEGVGQAKAVIFFLIVAVIALGQLYVTRRKEVEQ
ncbi:MAG: sugar ABC transporter permease [Actinomycetaceae bacterium]|nr:sugar ABC transporter permease [Actinomycetaceae bacterium]